MGAPNRSVASPHEPHASGAGSRIGGTLRQSAPAVRRPGSPSKPPEEKIMNGYQITFFTQGDRRQHGKPLADWLVQLSRDLGLRGATIIPASEGFGHHRRIHSAHFFELADQPLEVLMAVSTEEADRLFDRLKAEGVQLFYVKTAVEFGTLGTPDE